MRTALRLLVLVLIGCTTTAPTPSVGASAEPAVSSSAPTPRETTYTRYEGTFTTKLLWDRWVEYGEFDYAGTAANVAISGTLPSVRFADTTLLGSVGQGRLDVSGKVQTVQTSNDAEQTTTCRGASVTPATSVPPSLVPVNGRNTFYAFSSLSAPMTCEDTVVPGTFTRVLDLQALPVPITVPPASVGAATITIPIDRTLPTTSCPGYEGDITTVCTYRLRGTLTLRLVPDIDTFRAPTRGGLTRAASRARVTAQCGSSCSVAVTVRPLRGRGSATTRTTLRPRTPTVVGVPCGTKLRRAIRVSGGARLTVTYRAGGATRSYVLRVRT